MLKTESIFFRLPVSVIELPKAIMEVYLQSLLAYKMVGNNNCKMRKKIV